MFRSFIIVSLAFFLSGCAEKPPKCSDSDVQITVKEFITNTSQELLATIDSSLNGLTVLQKSVLKAKLYSELPNEVVDVKMIDSLGYEDGVRKCKAEFHFGNGDTLMMRYNITLDKDNPKDFFVRFVDTDAYADLYQKAFERFINNLDK